MKPVREIQEKILRRSRQRIVELEGRVVELERILQPRGGEPGRVGPGRPRAHLRTARAAPHRRAAAR